jgi:hypothetical protein
MDMPAYFGKSIGEDVDQGVNCIYKKPLEASLSRNLQCSAIQYRLGTFLLLQLHLLAL